MTSQFNEAVAAFQRGDLDRARALGEQLLAAGAEAAGLDHLLGLIDCRTGRLESGVERLRRALEKASDDISVRVMLARALVDSGRAAEALEIAQPPSGTSPAELALWHARAEAAMAVEAWAEAADAWGKLCLARPDDWPAWSNLGNALAAQERWTESADALGRAAALKPDEAAIRRNLAAALGQCSLIDESIAELQTAVRLEPDHVQTRLSLARLLADASKTEEAMMQLGQASRIAHAQSGGIRLIEIAGVSPEGAGVKAVSATEEEAVRELGLLLERTNQMDLLRELLDQAVEAGIAKGSLGYLWAASALRENRADDALHYLLQESAATDPVRWNRLMAKIADARGDAVGAFAAATEMNRAVHDYSDWRARGSKYRRQIRDLAQLMTREWTSRLPVIPSATRRSPAFLVGFPRSGTTLLDTFLMGHPDTEVLEEVHMLGAAEQVVGRVAQLPNASAQTLERAREAYFAELDRHVEPTFAGLVIDKLPLNMLGLAFIHSLFPDAKIVFAQRHPCDVVLSGFMQSFVMNEAMACFLDIGDAADFYDGAMEVWTRSRELVPTDVRTIIYEDLVTDPEASLRPLIDFLGLPWRRELLDHRSTAKARGAIITPSYDQVIQPLSKAPTGRWRRYEKQLEPVLPVLLPWAKRLGYDD